MNDRPRALTVLISIFLAGCIIGAAIGFFLWARRMPDFSQNRGGPQFFGTARPRGVQGGRPGGGPGGGQWLPELLKLTPEQSRRLMQVMEDFRDQLNDLRIEQEKTSRYQQAMEEFRRLQAEQEPKIKAIETDTNRKISAILNKEQNNKFAEWQKQFEERRNRGPRGGGGFGPPAPPPQNREQKINRE
jgi:hypothetical protein